VDSVESIYTGRFEDPLDATGATDKSKSSTFSVLAQNIGIGLWASTMNGEL